MDFVQKRSTTDAILDISGHITENLDKSLITIAVFLDMSKAFDSIDHGILLGKMRKLGIRGKANDWFRLYLSNRKLKVNYNGTYSGEKFIKYGCPQGTNLGPLLYIIFSNEMKKILMYSNAIVFADDTTIYICGNNLRFMTAKLTKFKFS